MRLIDADLLKQNCKITGQFQNNFQCVDLITLGNVIDNQPTAYDVDKVIEEINETREIFESRHIVPCINTDKATEIVRKGGIE